MPAQQCERARQAMTSAEIRQNPVRPGRPNCHASAATFASQLPDRGESLACAGSRPIKKLPQVGQEPVEAVESRPISPDGLHNTRKLRRTQRYFAKNRRLFRRDRRIRGQETRAMRLQHRPRQTHARRSPCCSQFAANPCAKVHRLATADCRRIVTTPSHRRIAPDGSMLLPHYVQRLAVLCPR